MDELKEEPPFRYWAFVSYSSADKALAKRLHRQRHFFIPLGVLLVLVAAWALYSYSGPWRETGHLLWPRRGHKALLLQDGRVLVFGGFDKEAVLDCEVFNPSTETWSAVGKLQADLLGVFGTVLPDGTVLFIESLSETTITVATHTTPYTRKTTLSNVCQFFDPKTNSWSGLTNCPVFSPSIVVSLKDRRVLVYSYTADSAIYNPFTKTGQRLVPPDHPYFQERNGICLEDGRALIFGWIQFSGMTGTSRKSTSTTGAVTIHGATQFRYFDPTTGSWSASIGGLNALQFNYENAFQIQDGRVFFITDHLGMQILDPKTNHVISRNLDTHFREGTMCQLSSGRILVAGGEEEIWNPWKVGWPVGGNLRGWWDIFLNNRVVKVVADCHLFDPSLMKWSEVPPLRHPRYDETMTVLQDGRVLVVGGFDANEASLASCEWGAVE